MDSLREYSEITCSERHVIIIGLLKCIFFKYIFYEMLHLKMLT
jgi:hypothetical protein